MYLFYNITYFILNNDVFQFSICFVTCSFLFFNWKGTLLIFCITFLTCLAACLTLLVSTSVTVVVWVHIALVPTLLMSYSYSSEATIDCTNNGRWRRTLTAKPHVFFSETASCGHWLHAWIPMGRRPHQRNVNVTFQLASRCLLLTTCSLTGAKWYASRTIRPVRTGETPGLLYYKQTNKQKVTLVIRSSTLHCALPRKRAKSLPSWPQCSSVQRITLLICSWHKSGYLHYILFILFRPTAKYWTFYTLTRFIYCSAVGLSIIISIMFSNYLFILKLVIIVLSTFSMLVHCATLIGFTCYLFTISYLFCHLLQMSLVLPIFVNIFLKKYF